MNKVIACLVVVLIAISCKVSYSFKSTSIDYTKIKTIDIRDFQNQATNVYPPLAQEFNEHLKDVFTRNTKLQFVKNKAANLELEGEITRYDIMPLAVQENAIASLTRLTMSVRIRFINNVNPAEDKEETFTAYRDFSSNKTLNEVQDDLIVELKKDIVDQIFNATMANW
ncbi:MAG: hypothetical protein RL662_1897 [Bacteroidota bacterium]|jgi:hypothetical protein